MYKSFGNIVCDCCETNVSSIDFIVVKSKDGIFHYCDDKCKTSEARNERCETMTEKERNKRLFLLLNELLKIKDLDSIELLRTMVEKDSESMKHSFKIMTDMNQTYIELKKEN